MLYDILLNEATHLGVDVYEMPMSPRNKGLYSNNVIWINKYLATRAEKACALAEEIGHHKKTVGTILDQSKIENRQQELRARSWGYERVFTLSKIVQAHKAGIRNRHELADYLGIAEEYLDEALKRFQDKYGLYVAVGKYTICFDPLGVLEMFDF
ncbi:ImmA/IrrE family metallo-endopeptidase [Paenibacillus sp. P26]|nr:ImmA/IrrE family metallo-endopeptidase [Paenibacillus sp. P26]